MTTNTIDTPSVPLVDFTRKTAVCTFFLGTDYSSITLPVCPELKTKGGKTTVAMIGEDSDYRGLDIAAVKLLTKLSDARSNTITLTFDELGTFKALSERFPDTGSTPTTNGTVLVAPSAPVAPIPTATPTVAQETTSTSNPPIAPAVEQNVSVVPHNATNGHVENVTPATVPMQLEIVQVLPSSPELDYWSQRREDMLAEHRRRQMVQTTQEGTDSDPIWEVKYYIPSAVSQPSELSGRDAMFADMARRMRQAGLLQWDGSCYYGRERHVKPLDAILRAEVKAWNERPDVAITARWRKGRRLVCQWKARPVTAEEMAEIRGEAFLKLLDLMTEVAEALQDSLANGAQAETDTLVKLDEEKTTGGEGPTQRKLWMARDKRIRNMSSAISRARTDLRLAQECVEAFGEGDEMEELTLDVERVIADAQSDMEDMRRAQKSTAGK